MFPHHFEEMVLAGEHLHLCLCLHSRQAAAGRPARHAADLVGARRHLAGGHTRRKSLAQALGKVCLPDSNGNPAPLARQCCSPGMA